MNNDSAGRARHWLDTERLRVYPRLFLAVYLIGAIVWVALSRHGVDPKGKPLGYDYITFWTASELALEGRAVAVYDLRALVSAEHAVVPGTAIAHSWQYPPTFLLLILPASLLPFLLSYCAFIATTLAGYLAVARRILSVPGSLMPLLAFPGIFINASQGQNAFLTAALIGAGLLLLPKRPLLAGLLFGVLTIKPHLGLLLPIALLVARQWRAIAATAATTVALIAISLAAFGTATLDAFAKSLPKVANWVSNDGLPLDKIPTAFAFARRLGLPEGIAYGLQAAFALTAALLVARLWMRSSDPSLRNAGLVVGSLLASSYLFDYDLAWLGLALAWFVDYGLRQGWRRGERELLVAVWLLPMLVVPVCQLLHFQFAPLLLLAFLSMIVRRSTDRLSTAEVSTCPS